MRTGITFDDVLLIPKKSSVLSRSDVNIESKLTKKISLKVPIISSNMDTVTESDMAISMARAGGVGIIHRFNSINDQVELVKSVKRAENKIIKEPYRVSLNTTLDEIKFIINVYLNTIILFSTPNILYVFIFIVEVKIFDLVSKLTNINKCFLNINFILN